MQKEDIRLVDHCGILVTRDMIGLSDRCDYWYDDENLKRTTGIYFSSKLRTQAQPYYMPNVLCARRVN